LRRIRIRFGRVSHPFPEWSTTPSPGSFTRESAGRHQVHEATRPEQDGQEPIIADAGDLPLDLVLTGDESVLSNSLRRVVEEYSRPGESYAAHSSSS
jgi:FXSXX-COOH protein